jgi:hypothetical protein
MATTGLDSALSRTRQLIDNADGLLQQAAQELEAEWVRQMRARRAQIPVDSGALRQAATAPRDRARSVHLSYTALTVTLALRQAAFVALPPLDGAPIAALLSRRLHGVAP